MPSFHYKYGSSTAARTLQCQQWRRLADKMPPPPESDAAREGTAMHYLFELGNEDPSFMPEDHVGESVEGVRITQEHAEKVITALEIQDRMTAELSLDIEPEVTLATDAITGDENVGGTLDIIGMNHEDNIFYIADLKTGDGVMVYAEENSQLLFGAYMAVVTGYDGFAFNEDTVFKLCIIQPSDRRDEPLDVWTTDLRAVLDWGKRYERAVKAAEAGMGACKTGDHCKFCPAVAICPAKREVVEKSLRIHKDTEELAALNEAMAIIDEVEDWCRAIRKLAHEQAELGVKIDGWKLVDKRATRKWTDAEAVEEIARKQLKLRVKDIMDQKLLTPAQLEKVCKKFGKDFDKLNDYVTMHSSGTTLAHDDDPRPTALAPAKALDALAKRLEAKQ